LEDEVNQCYLTSRNKREGGYLGKYKSAYDNDAPIKKRHHRKGGSPWKTLKQKAIFNRFPGECWGESSFGSCKRYSYDSDIEE
jgi:hypothetical protein